MYTAWKLNTLIAQSTTLIEHSLLNYIKQIMHVI